MPSIVELLCPQDNVDSGVGDHRLTHLPDLKSISSILERFLKKKRNMVMMLRFTNILRPTCIWPRPNGPRSPPREADEQSENCLANSSKVASPDSIWARYP